VFVVLLIVAAGVLTPLALGDDYYAWLAPKFGLKDEKKLTASREFLKAREEAEHNARRTVELINRRETLPDGTLSEVRLIPKEGAVSLLRNDPLARGPRLFGQHCASCHDFIDPAGKSPWKFETPHDPAKADGAPNLFGFASRAWIKGLLDPNQIASPSYFGNTNHKSGRMATWIKQHGESLQADLDAIAAALSAQAELESQGEADSKDTELIRRGVGLIEQNCARGCHKFGDQGQLGLAPDLTGYGSYEWMLGLVSDPTHERFYRIENDRMPSFAKDLEHPERNNVSVRELSLIVDWLRGQYYRSADLFPILPHNEDDAEHAAALARTTANPWTNVVGAPPAMPATNDQKAERLFANNCAACHGPRTRSVSEATLTRSVSEESMASSSAPNLSGFGSRQWLAGLLDPKQIESDRYFGQTRHAKGEMASFVNDNLAELDEAGQTKLQSIIAALAAEASLPAEGDANKAAEQDGTLAKGRKALSQSFDSSSCTDCHKFRDEGDLGSAPDLTGWGSKDWLVRFITDPTHEAFYRDTNDRMPSFGKSAGAKKSLLTAEEIERLARWLRGEELKAQP
jgi:ubiquinol-cytochrome c reductase cytochrome b subunit